MIPKIDFGFLICSYLPGVPIAVALYVCQLRSVINDGDSSNGTMFLVLAPIICGLFLDAIRHTLGKIPFKWMHKIFGWELLPIDHMKMKNSKYLEAFFSSILSITATYYHLYEFFGNFLLSCLFAFPFFLLTDTAPAGKTTIYYFLAILSVLSLMGMWVFANEQKKNITHWFK